MPPRIFLALWAFSHLLYPFWFPLDGSPGRAALQFAVLCAAGLALLRFLRGSLRKAGEADPVLSEILTVPRDPVLWGLVAAAAAIRLYPMTLPIHLWGAGDEAVHMAFPALAFKAWSRFAGFPFLFVFWPLAAFAAARRRSCLARAREALEALSDFKPKALVVAAVAATAWFFLAYSAVSRLSRSGYPTLPSDLLRFPPLGKAVHAAAYAAFGVSDFTGRLPELLFYCAGATLVYKLAAGLRSKTAARLAAMTYLFLPPMAYYASRGSQTHGELFFYLLSAFCFSRWLAGGDARALNWTALTAAAGTLFRYTVLPLVALLGAAALLAWARDPKRLPVTRRTALDCGAMALFGAAPWAASYFLYGLRPYAAGTGGRFWEGLLEPALSLPAGVSWPVAVLLASGFVLALLRPKNRLQWFLLAWFGLYYAFIGADMGWDVRLTLPMYPPLILWAAEALAGTGKAAGPLGAALFAWLLWIGLWAPAPPLQPEFTLRRGLETEYAPLGLAAATIDSLPSGSRVLTVDCSRGCFGFYLPRPDRLVWTAVESARLDSSRALARLCRERGVETVVYTAGTAAAMGERKNPRLFDEFAADGLRFSWRADYRLGANRVAIKDVRSAALEGVDPI